MNNILRMKLYSAGITSPDLLRHAIDHATSKAYTPRITPSRRYRRWKVNAVRLAVVAAALYAIGVNL